MDFLALEVNFKILLLEIMFSFVFSKKKKNFTQVISLGPNSHVVIVGGKAGKLYCAFNPTPVKSSLF